MSISIATPSTIHTSVCGIYRWPSKAMEIKPGPYYSIIVNWDVVNLLAMDKDSKWNHAVAVVDNFGDLVGVPA